MDTNLDALKQAITAASQDLEHELHTVSQAQGTQISLAVRRQIPVAKRLLTELERDRERQIADDPATTAANTGIQPKLFQDIKESLGGFSDAAYDAVKQDKAKADKQATLPGFREKNPNAQPKPPRISWAKRAKEAEAKVAHLEGEKARLEREVIRLRAENHALRRKIEQSRTPIGV